MSEQTHMTMTNSVGEVVLKSPIQCKQCGEFDYTPCDGDAGTLPERIKQLEDELTALRTQQRERPKMLNHDDLAIRVRMPVYNANAREWRVIEDIDAGEDETEYEDENLYTVCFTDGSKMTIHRLGCSGLYDHEPQGDRHE